MYHVPCEELNVTTVYCVYGYPLYAILLSFWCAFFTA